MKKILILCAMGALLAAATAQAAVTAIPKGQIVLTQAEAKKLQKYIYEQAKALHDTRQYATHWQHEYIKLQQCIRTAALARKPAVICLGDKLY